ncbi:Arginase/deacetylase [Suhomyces tanzawaensis NRRL Y-17324]|uniref:Arginase/deacetylase n=1 Tax=Suhomyces tanzawaensis NRRL Y-17324 TaxID=984487 RepID=A0A1E4SFV5_9ASCO|nr:Arginase/deacetylase [Suhomyces tanzawaensis NRRL Y-17324]ODV78393.1 Arginase/deacetylase [Suhomyces tanzawaensis NRRL Y-17324]
MAVVIPKNDSEESLISQFETTLTIRPSSNDVDEDNDISIDHTVLHNTTVNYTRDHSVVDIEELEENEIRDEQIPQFKSRRRYSLQPTEKLTKEKAYRIKAPHKDRVTSATSSKPGSKSPTPTPKSPSPDPLETYRHLLEPSPLIDYQLTRFTKTFQEFLGSNPHIQTESPRFVDSTDKTLILLSPYSAEHAFGRKWVTRSYLSTIFERPQRLLAACIGVSAAVTMFPFFYEVFNSTKRSSALSSHVMKVHGKNWPKKLIELCLESADKLDNDNIEVPGDWNTGDIYLTPKTINAIEGVLGTIETSIDSLYGKGEQSHNLVFVMIRPPGHHSHACLPSGFCLLNNVHVGIEYAFEKYQVTHCAILDIDLHHGDGSQDICWERAGFQGDYGQEEDDELEPTPRDEYGKRFAKYPKVGYFSLHDIKSYPTELGYATRENIKNASTCIMDHDLNIWNVHLQDWKNEEEFYKHYQTKYVQILNRANQFLNQAKKQYEQEYQEYLANSAKYNKYLLKPHLYNQPIEKPVAPPPFKPLIAISAGFDASEYESPHMQRHGINVPTSFYATFTKDVVKLAKIHTGGKVVSFLEGGYSDGALSTGIFSHLIGLNNDDEFLWNQTWGTEQVMKELVKGCKKNWVPYKKPQSDITIWANEVIKLARSMMPNAILPANYIYQSQPPEEKAPPIKSPMKDPEDDRKVLRHTRSYFKKISK